VSALETIAGKATSANLGFLLIGGYAVMAHGFARSTYDLDLLVPRSDAAKWRDLVAELGFAFFREGPTFLQFHPPSADFPPLDLMLVGDDTFGQMQAASVVVDAGSIAVKAVSLEHLIALKCHSIRHGGARRSVKDAEDVIQLIQANRLDPARDPLRALILRQGGQQLYDKLRRAIAPA
jgi:hypothetical protein